VILGHGGSGVYFALALKRNFIRIGLFGSAHASRMIADSRESVPFYLVRELAPLTGEFFIRAPDIPVLRQQGLQFALLGASAEFKWCHVLVPTNPQPKRGA
jgi:hypothetical protein